MREALEAFGIAFGFVFGALLAICAIVALLMLCGVH